MRERRMKVMDLDLPAAVEPVTGCGGYDELRALVRHRGRPVGWAAVHLDGRDSVSPSELLDAVAARLGHALAPLALGPRADDRRPTSYVPISVVVCTRDRPDLLAGCLEALAALDYPAYEVVLVDNAPTTDATARLAAAYPVRYVRENRPGLDWARNRGIAEASHDLVAFTDDDARVDRGWLQAIALAFADPTVSAVTGLVAPSELETRAQRLFELGYGGMGKGMQPRRFERSRLDAAELLAIQAVGVGANMAFRRRVFEAVGGFDTALDVGTPASGAGDLDMFHRVVAAGLVLAYEPTALVWHRHRPEMAALQRQLYADGRSYGVYLIKRWHERNVGRAELGWFAVGRWGFWLTGRLLLGLAGRHRLPLPLLVAALRGALYAPWAYRRTYESDRRLRNRSSDRFTRPTAPVTAATDSVGVNR